nr:mucin-17-like [Ciona intestinalis]|eukprot:XP_002119179.3 mucin-17-like [Ciona intestinalis]
MRVGTGPRCCYGSRERNFNRWWGWWLGGPIIEGPRGSRYERHQIPIVERSTSRWWWWSSIWYREQSVLDRQYQLAMDNDLKPRRHCCIESESNFYCGLYKQNRPTATCEGYVQRWPSWNWGDPHITTTDGNSYTFNGIGEYHYLYAPDVLSVQGRIKKATKEDGTEAGGTIFVSFAIRDFTFNTSGIVQFDVDPNHVNGTGILVRVNGVLQNNITETAMDVNQVSLSTSSGAVEAAFPSGSSASVSASDFMLSMEFTGDTNSLMNISKGLLGAWNGIKSDDFEFRNGTVLKLSDIEVTENSDILNGTLSEQKLYPFGLSWKIMEDESIFNYTGGNDTYALHNPTPTSDPPFLEVLVKEQAGQSHFESVKANCTTNGVVSTTCLYDVLVTNRTEIGQTTLSDAATSSAVASANANTPPNATISDGDHVENGNTFLAKLNSSSTMTVSAIDPDGDSVTFHIFPNNSVAGITVDENSGVVSWTPTEANRIQGTTNQTLVIQAIDSNGGETLLTVNIKLCVCNNSGVCLYNETLLGVENYEVINPFVNPVTVLSKSLSCVTVLIDDGSLYGLYEVKAVSNQNNFLVNSSAIKTKICGLSPNTQYNISVRVLALKGSNQLFTTTEFSAITAAKTDALKIRLSLRVLSETFVTEMSNIASASAVAFRGRHESTLNNGLVFTNGGNTLTSSVLVFIRLSAGSVRADSEALLTSQNMADSSATAAGTNLDSAVYADVMTITDFPDPPANLVISEVTDSTITVRYDEVASAIHYEIQLTCTTTSVNLVTTSTTYTIPDLPSNTICSVQVRVLVALVAAAARSDYSDSIETTTVPAVLGLQATSITETSAVISFNSVTRGVYYTVQSAASPINLTQSQVVSGNLSLSVGGLVKSTTYTYTVVAVALDVDGNLHSSAPATLTFTTSGLCGVNPCFNGGLCSEDGTLVGCLCPSGYTGILCEAKDNSEALKIGLGVTGGVIGGALIVLVLVWYVKKRPQAYSLHPDEKPSNFEE